MFSTSRRPPRASPFGGPDPPAAVFHYSRNRSSIHPERHLAKYAGILQADAYSGYNKPYKADREAGRIAEAACWAHARRKFFELADIARKARAETKAAISPLALEAVRRIDEIFAHERNVNGMTQDAARASARTHRSARRCDRNLDA